MRRIRLAKDAKLVLQKGGLPNVMPLNAKDGSARYSEVSDPVMSPWGIVEVHIC